MIELLSDNQKQEIIRLIEIKYIDGVTNLINVDLDDNGNITGIFEDKISSKFSEKFLFKITNNEVGYKQIKNFNYSSLEVVKEEINKVDFRAIIHRVIKWNGLDVGLEYEPGDIRFKGTGYERKLRCGYGHIRKYLGADGEALDCYLAPSFFNGENPSDNIYQIDQLSLDDGDFDEHKFMIGFDSIEEARQAYFKEMTPQHFGGIQEVNINDLEQYKKQINYGEIPHIIRSVLDEFKAGVVELTEKIKIEGRVLSEEEYNAIALVNDDDVQAAIENWKEVASETYSNLLSSVINE